MGNFFAELKRRHIYRVGAAYAVVAWVLLQLVNNVAPVLDLPAWVARATILLLVIGFPVALLLAWVVEAAPAVTKHKVGKAAPAAPGHDRIDWILVGALIVVIALVSYQQLAPAPATRAARASEAGIVAARAAAASPHGAISLAVLPFVNLSPDKDQEFFSDGMTEEITTALAKVPDLRVVARTSAFEFKGKNVNIKTLSEQLGATHLIEGSVRKAGNRLRITAQLIKADDGTHIWAEDYDRELNDVFAIQEDIARAITAALRMPLGLKPGENLVNSRGIDPDSYQKYLSAIGVLNGREGDHSYDEAASSLREVVAKNPAYAPGWAALSFAYFLRANGHSGNINESVDQSRAQVNDLREKGELAAQTAIRLDASNVPAINQLAGWTWSRGRFAEAEDLFRKSQRLDPSLPPGGLSLRLGQAGRMKEALDLTESAYRIEPFFPQVMQSTAHDRWISGQTDSAIALAKNLRPINRAPILAMIYASLGRFGDSADALMEIAGTNRDAAAAARLLRAAPAKISGVDNLPPLPGQLAFVWLYVGAPERALEIDERRVEVGYQEGNQLAFVWHPSYAAVRKTERFKALMRKAGFVDYWRAKGWPQWCHPTTGDDFACE